ncbi:MAG TPA: Rieske (2Fe-2S) protein [Actinopolymorphaceae bacterium]
MKDTNQERRRVLRGVAAAGVAVPLIAACGGEDPEAGKQPAENTDPESTEEETPEESTQATPEDSAPAGSLGSAADIPVGGGKVFPSQKVVVTQPEDGVYKAFSAICTHNRCVVATVADKRIKCGCHNSEFDFSTGEPVQGPNGRPASTITALPGKQVSVEGGNLTVT